jgi:outer membrane protein W
MKSNIALLIATALMLAGTVRADDSDKFLIRGDTTKVTMEQNQINVATAEAIGKACVEEAVKRGVRISIVILDQFGEPVYFYRMDGQGKINIETAS